MPRMSLVQYMFSRQMEYTLKKTKCNPGLTESYILIRSGFCRNMVGAKVSHLEIPRVKQIGSMVVLV